MNTTTKRRLVTLACLLLFFGLLLFFTLFFWNDLAATASDPEALKNALARQGAVGKLIFTLLMAAQVVLAVIPGHPFEVAGGYCYGVFGGTLLCSAGAALGSLIAFVISRLVGAKAVNIFYNKEKVKKVFFLKTTERRNLFTFIVFLVPGIPKDMVAYFMGITEMRLPTFLLLSTVGRLPGILLAAAAGAAVQGGSFVLLVVLLAVLLPLTILLYFLFRKQIASADSPPSDDAQ